MGLNFVGMGVSGGEEGALNGPSIMPGGPKEAYDSLGPLLEDISAQGRRRRPAAPTSAPTARATSSRWSTTASSTPTCSSSPRPTTCCAPGSGWTRPAIADVFPSGTRAAWTPTSSRSPRRCSRTTTPPPASRSSTSSPTRPSRRAPGAGRCRLRSTSASRSPASPRPRSRARSRATGRCATPRRDSPGSPGRSSRARRPRASPTTSSRRSTPRRSSPTPRASTRSRPAPPSTAGRSTSAQVAKIWRGGCIIRAKFLNEITAAYEREPGPHDAAHRLLVRRGPRRGAGLVAPGRRGVGPARHPDARLLLGARLLRRDPGRPPARGARPGPARLLRCPHLPPHRQAGHVPHGLGDRGPGGVGRVGASGS